MTTQTKAGSLPRLLRRAYKQRNLVNRELARLYAKDFNDLIESTTSRMRESYKLSEQDLEDLRQGIRSRLFSVDWMAVIRRSRGRRMSGYLVTTVSNMAVKELDDITRHGFSGLSGTKIKDRPQYGNQLMTIVPPCEDGQSHEKGQIEEPADPRLVEEDTQDQQILDKALGTWDEKQRKVMNLKYGLETGASMADSMIAREMGMTIREVQEIMQVALLKARAELGIVNHRKA